MPRNPATIWVSKTVAGTVPQAAMKHVEVLGRGVRHGNAGATEHRRQRGGVDGERVDEGHLVLPGDLNERQIGDVGPLGVELGVEGVVVLRGHLGDQRLETLRCRPPWSRGAVTGGPGDRGQVRSSSRQERLLIFPGSCRGARVAPHG